MAVVSDEVATGLTTGPDGKKQRDLSKRVVMLTGWVSHKAGAATLMLTDDPFFQRSLEIRVNDVVYQLPGAKRPLEEAGRSVLWVERAAVVTEHRTQTAAFFAGEDADGIGNGDPAGGYGGPGSRKP